MVLPTVELAVGVVLVVAVSFFVKTLVPATRALSTTTDIIPMRALLFFLFWTHAFSLFVMVIIPVTAEDSLRVSIVINNKMC